MDRRAAGVHSLRGGLHGRHGCGREGGREVFGRGRGPQMGRDGPGVGGSGREERCALGAHPRRSCSASRSGAPRKCAKGCGVHKGKARRSQQLCGVASRSLCAASAARGPAAGHGPALAQYCPQRLLRAGATSILGQWNVACGGVPGAIDGTACGPLMAMGRARGLAESWRDKTEGGRAQAMYV